MILLVLMCCAGISQTGSDSSKTFCLPLKLAQKIAARIDSCDVLQKEHLILQSSYAALLQVKINQDTIISKMLLIDNQRLRQLTDLNQVVAANNQQLTIADAQTKLAKQELKRAVHQRNFIAGGGILVTLAFLYYIIKH